ncbi:caspase family protein [Sulfitobacter sp. F26204]|uniref:caspase family protein n=1 Tax=Sulfitobacter sp. F26204 TaxID=2996014 RepID=UPI00225E2B55|nr:caspase family protein [Sulfitobacter sp. F26204]MCX7560280.1 caspase family protein [Sulfitobacter sp. F26204]
MVGLSGYARLLASFVMAVLLFSVARPVHADRVALVVGNSQYRNTQPLANPRNDAEAIAAKLRELDFEVFDGYDLTRTGFEDLIRDFARHAQDADAAAFYYAGHGLEVGSVNYLVPVDANIRDEADLKFETINLNDILGFMEREQRTNLVFLDACRDNPIARNLSLNMGTRSVAVGRGLAPIDTGVGTLIAYSTQPGNVALDGEGRHSPFTAALLDHMATPDLDVEIMMRSVRRDVMQETGGQQVPWSSSSLTGSFIFRPLPPKETTAPVPKPSPTPEVVVAPAPETVVLPAPVTEPVPSTAGQTVPRAQLPQMESASSPDTSMSERELVLKSQAALNRLGCDAGNEDGIWGRKSRDALARLVKHAPTTIEATQEPSVPLLRQMERLSGKICPLVCQVTEHKVNDACVRKTCPAGQRLSSKGLCYSPPVAKTQRRSTSKPSSSCFTLNGSTYCQ